MVAQTLLDIKKELVESISNPSGLLVDSMRSAVKKPAMKKSRNPRSSQRISGPLRSSCTWSVAPSRRNSMRCCSNCSNRPEPWTVLWWEQRNVKGWIWATPCGSRFAAAWAKRWRESARRTPTASNPCFGAMEHQMQERQCRRGGGGRETPFHPMVKWYSPAQIQIVTLQFWIMSHISLGYHQSMRTFGVRVKSCNIRISQQIIIILYHFSVLDYFPNYSPNKTAILGIPSLRHSQVCLQKGAAHRLFDPGATGKGDCVCDQQKSLGLQVSGCWFAKCSRWCRLGLAELASSKSNQALR